MMLATIVYVIVLPLGMLTVSLILPEPEAVKPVAPPVAMAVKVLEEIKAGSVSVTVAPETLLGPALVTTTV